MAEDSKAENQEQVDSTPGQGAVATDSAGEPVAAGARTPGTALPSDSPDPASADEQDKDVSENISAEDSAAASAEVLVSRQPGDNRVATPDSSMGSVGVDKATPTSVIPLTDEQRDLVKENVDRSDHDRLPALIDFLGVTLTGRGHVEFRRLLDELVDGKVR